MPLTEAEIREKLGLKSHAEHEYDVFLNELPQRAKETCWTKEQLVRARYRHTGRTTEMLIRALGAVSAGHRVILVGHTFDHASRMTKQARRWADALGLRPDMITGESYNQRAMGIPWTEHSGVLVFADHYNGGEG